MFYWPRHHKPFKTVLMQINTLRDRTLIQAVLGPTNTGKTHLAMESMLSHASGVIGFPLRLLARENYDRAVKIKGPGAVALVTGEEKIIPQNARYFLTTVESMPAHQNFDFAAIDEIQLCADPDRGHIFTDRLLHYRGARETMFLGADTMRPLINALVKGVKFVSKPRLSALSFSGYKKLSRLKPRTCIVAFSANDVYSIAELIRRQSGGASIVMGALSPRTRNAQVDMFQSGEVDYLVATDAVGMGLNMDVNHVALAATRKFDGRTMRDLSPAELAQIAGRAGRHLNDGTFGTTADVTGLPYNVVEQIQNHNFKPLAKIFWRNTNLQFVSLKQLKDSLAERPQHGALHRVREAADEQALEHMTKDEAIVRLACTPSAVRLLWDVARIPDFRKTYTDDHPQLLGRIYNHLMTNTGRIPSDWLDERVKRVERLDGDIDVLMARIASVRTWTYVTHQSSWLDDATGWQNRTRAAEDQLSTALHNKLTQRFVDKRTSQLVKTLEAGDMLATALHDDGGLEVEGHHLGKLNGFRFIATESETPLAAKVLDSAARKALRSKIVERITLLQAESDDAFSFSADGKVSWRAEPIATITRGPKLLAPTIKVMASDLLDADQKDFIEARLNLWLKNMVVERLGLLLVATLPSLNGAVRGLVFQLSESLGALPRHEADAEIKSLEREDRQSLRKLGVRIGRQLIYIPALLRPAAVQLSVLLWAVHDNVEPLAPPPAGRVSFKREKHEPEGWLRAAGFRQAGNLYVRADMLERMSELAWKRIEEAKGSFIANEDFLALAGCRVDELPPILQSLGFVPAKEEGKWSPKRRGHKNPKPAAQKKSAPKPAAVRPVKIDPDSPFAILQGLKLKK